MQCVTVVAPARLHLGFLDLGGSLGRRFGSIGVGIEEISTRVTLTRAAVPSVEGPDAARAAAAVRAFERSVGRSCPAAIQIDRVIPSHAGLGSGTQLALAIGAGLSRLYELDLSAREMAPWFERGARSGIGIAVFEGGGLVVDGGRGERTATPPLLSRLELPSSWRFLLVLDRSGPGLHGAEERVAFRQLPPFPAATAAHLCHLLLLRALPAVVEADLAAFGSVISELQQRVGEHFAPVQGGAFSSPEVAAAIHWLGARGGVALGQSSWGPTGFCLIESPEHATALLRGLRAEFAGQPELEFLVATPRNRGADIEIRRYGTD